MSEWGEPRRFYESELPPEVRAVLESAALDEPSHERVGAVEARLGAVLGWAASGGPRSETGGSGSHGGGGAGPATGASLGAGKVLAGVVVLAGAIGATAWLADRDPGLAATQRREHVAAPHPEPAETRAADEPREAPVPREADEPREAPEPPRPPPDPSPRTAATPRADRPNRHRPPREDPPPHPTMSTLEQELRLVDDARDALDAAPERALELADAHRTEFPQGTLAPERELIAVEALFALGRTADAEARASALQRDFPASPAAHRARTLIMTSPSHQ